MLLNHFAFPTFVCPWNLTINLVLHKLVSFSEWVSVLLKFVLMLKLLYLLGVFRKANSWNFWGLCGTPYHGLWKLQRSWQSPLQMEEYELPLLFHWIINIYVSCFLNIYPNPPFNICLFSQGKPPDWQDFVGIITLLVINSTISFIEENNAGNAAAALMARLAPKAKVFDWIQKLIVWMNISNTFICFWTWF